MENLIKNAINDLYQAAMKPIMNQKAKTYKSFLTQREFEENIGKIFIITGARRNLEEYEKLNKHTLRGT